MTIPEIVTDRLRLRELKDADLDACARMYADLETMRFMGHGKPLDRAETWRSLAFMRGHWIFRGFGMWAVELKATGEYLGRVGLHYPEGWPDIEVGWMIGRDHWGHGYATEAAQVAVKYGFETLGLERIISLIVPGNERSIRVAEKLGESRYGSDQMLGREVLVYELLKRDWKKQLSTPK